jgi:hypothetical protein
MTTPSTANSPVTAAKRARKREPTQTPPEWFDLFRQHDDAMVRVRLLWRRGGGRYRPIVPINLALEDMENAPLEDWEDLELRESHFDWATVEGENFVERDKRIEEAARDLWAVAVAWTRAKGPVCDFQLRGYGSEAAILFEDGKRCNLTGERSRYDDDPVERSGGIDESVRRLMSDERSSWRHLDQVKDGLISRLADERGRLFDNLDRASSAAPSIIGNVHRLLDRAIEFQKESVDRYLHQESGARELEAQAFAELQKSRRTDAVILYLKDLTQQGVNAALPFFQFMREQAGARFSVPEFRLAQQAIAYLALTVDEEQLIGSVDADSEDQARKIARGIMGILDRLSRTIDESQVVADIEPYLSGCFSRRSFRATATPEQTIAVNFIVGRVAMHRLMNHNYG